MHRRCVAYYMKYTVSIILTLIQFGAFGQLSQWTQKTVIKNKLKGVSVYTKVPKTNPAYYEKPGGLMPISEINFGRDGLVIDEICKDCSIRFHSDGPPSADEIDKYYFRKGRLVRIESMAFDKSTSMFYYDTLKKRRLIITLDKNEKRTDVRIELLNDDGKETATFGIDFDSIWTEGDSVYQIFLSKSISTYNGSTKTKKDFGYGGGTNIDKIRFEVFRNSLDFDEISKTFESLNYEHLVLWNHLTTYYDTNNNELKIIDENEGKPLREYKRDKNGLIETELIHFPKYTFEHLYKYKFWN
jgi:hypothetical protein